MKVYVITQYDVTTDQENVIAVYENEKEANEFTCRLWKEKGRYCTWCIQEFDLIESTQTPGK